MDEKGLEAKKHFAGEKKPSMKRRDDYNDYQGRRMYMITIETEGRKPLLGKVVGNPEAPRGSAEGPQLVPSELGRAVDEEWWGISRYYPQITVVALQLMPDHLHGILFVREHLPVPLGQVIRGFKTGCNRAWRTIGGFVAAQPQPTTHGEGTAPQGKAEAAQRPQGEGTAPQGAAGTQEVVQPWTQGPAVPGQTFCPLFARGFNDLILKGEKGLENWKHYLADNPRRLLMKRAKPEWLRPFFGLKIGAYTFNGIGNRELLMRPRLFVRISRRVEGELLAKTVNGYLQQAEKGTVLVSPSISPGEKQTMREAFNRHLPTIVVMANGFTPLSKPHGEQFEACAEGRLLMLAGWEHTNERITLTKPLCEQLNLMALEIENKHTTGPHTI